MSIMSKYTEKTLDKLLKKDLISIVLSKSVSKGWLPCQGK